jgi:hypothetical protein
MPEKKTSGSFESVLRDNLRRMKEAWSELDVESATPADVPVNWSGPNWAAANWGPAAANWGPANWGPAAANWGPANWGPAAANWGAANWGPAAANWGPAPSESDIRENLDRTKRAWAEFDIDSVDLTSNWGPAVWGPAVWGPANWAAANWGPRGERVREEGYEGSEE